MNGLLLIFRYKNTKTGKTGMDAIVIEKPQMPEIQEEFAEKAYAIGESIAKLKGFDKTAFWYSDTVEMPEQYEHFIAEIAENTLMYDCPL